MKIFDALKIYPQYLLPQHFLSSIMHKVTRSRSTLFKNFAINQVIKHFRVNMDDAVESDPSNFQTFNHFFTRALKADARPINHMTKSIVSPVDGTISQIGKINHDQIFQAKGHQYSLQELLANDAYCSKFIEGNFATIYLSPRDYHRIHNPISGKLIRMIHVPGQLFSVNTITTANVPNLFARNERVISLFETDVGLMAVILVGAIFVSSIETVWAGEVTPPSGKSIRTWQYDDQPFFLNKGDELGRFNMGSTAIILFETNKMNWENAQIAGRSVKMGELIGEQI